MQLWNDKKVTSLNKNHALIKKFWFHDDIFKSTFFDTSSILIPFAEEYIIQVMQRNGDKITDPKVQAAKEQLVVEEAAHAKVHRRYDEMIRKEGYKIDRYQKWMVDLARHFDKKFSWKSQLALCSTTEHVAATMSMIVVNQGILDKGIDERMRKIWLWHFMEELDHRSNSFDIYTHLVGGYFRRILIMIYITPQLLWYNFLTRNGLLYQSGHFWNLKIRLYGFRFLWGKNGLHRSIVSAFIRYMSPTFHPTKIHYAKDLGPNLHRYPIEDELITYFPGLN